MRCFLGNFTDEALCIVDSLCMVIFSGYEATREVLCFQRLV